VTTGPQRDRRSFHPGVLVSDLLVGACWLAGLVAMDALPLALIGTAYVVAASVYLAYFPHAWLAPWLGAAALWVWLVGSVMFENTATHYVVSLVSGVAVGGLCFAAWQASAAALRLGVRSLSGQRA
jgi:hypothetical protein